MVNELKKGTLSFLRKRAHFCSFIYISIASIFASIFGEDLLRFYKSYGLFGCTK